MAASFLYYSSFANVFLIGSQWSSGSGISPTCPLCYICFSRGIKGIFFSSAYSAMTCDIFVSGLIHAGFYLMNVGNV